MCIRDRKYLESFKTTKAAEGGRIGFSKGKLADIARRKFMKAAGAGVAGLAALKTGLLGFGKQATKEVAKEVITTPAAAGKPPWFDALVTRVIREGDDVTKTMATKDRQNVYRTKIDDETEIMVTQDLDEGVTRVDIDDPVRNVTGFDDPPTVSLQVTDEIVEEGGRIGLSKGKGVDLLRRGFLKTMGVAGAGIAALKSGILSLGGKQATTELAKHLSLIHISEPTRPY